MKNKILIKTGALLSAIVLLTSLASCGREISSNIYAADAVGETSQTFTGVIINARAVTVQDSERLQDNGMGIIGGGAGGALLGSQFGKGKGQTAAAILGAVGGAVGGAYAEKALKTQNGMEYVVQLENGEARTVVQGPNPQFAVGQNVYLLVSHKGRSRIIAR